MPENPLRLQEPQRTIYFDGLKGYGNSVVDFDFILRLKPPGDFLGFLESVNGVWPETDYAGLHAADPNWYELGRYQTGVLEPPLLEGFEDFFRKTRGLKADQILTPICNFTETPQGEGTLRDGWGGYDTQRRADLMIPVKGGLFDDWGQYLVVSLVEGTKPFELNRNARLIDEIKDQARIVGKQEMTDEEKRQNWIDSMRITKEKDEARKKHFEERSPRWEEEN